MRDHETVKRFRRIASARALRNLEVIADRLRTAAAGALLAIAAVVLYMLAPPAHAGNPTNPILFVTQVPIPEEVNTRDITQSFTSTVSPFGNHLADTTHAGRGGSLFIRFSNAQVLDLLSIADWSAIPGGKPAADAMAVRNPRVDWTGTKAIFSMTYGKPSGPNDPTTYLFQLYEITLPTQAQLAASVKPVLSKVPNQPAYNNVFPTYAQGGKIIFASDRPYDGSPHLTQREEYLSLPTLTGLWLLDPTNAASLKLLHHAPSGAFYPFVDSSGRVIFTNWDHLSRDGVALTDSRPPDPTLQENFVQTANGSGNFTDESANAAFTKVINMAPNSFDLFPEPRGPDKLTLKTYYPNLNGIELNLFLPWMIALDGTGAEVLNHVGRHEISGPFGRSYTDDAALRDFNPSLAASATNGNWGVHKFFMSFYAPVEDPLHAGMFFGADGPDMGTHGAGRIVQMNGAPGTNPDTMVVTYLTANAGAPPVKGGMNIPPLPISPSPVDLDLYRTPVPLADGNLVASHVAVRQTDYNTNTVASPQPVAGYNFRLRSLKPPVSPPGNYTNDVTLTNGITINTSYYAGQTLVAYNGPAWELDPVEVVARAEPPTPAAAAVHPVTASVFQTSGVHLPTFQSWLAANNAALSVSFDVTKRDLHDLQQPFNLRVSWSGHQTLKTGTSGKVYDIAWMRFYQGDLLRGYTLSGAIPVPGRRVQPNPMHTTMSLNVQAQGAPSGAVRIGDDGSVAAILPAGKAMTWEMLANDVAKTSQVKERFWVTFQPGEVRTCTNCHGINTSDQAGSPAPTNPPSALAALLAQWKGAHPSGSVQHATSTASAAKNAGMATLSVTRTGGSMGPASVLYATANGTALAGVDYTPSSGTLNWADGDTAPKSIAIPLLNGAGSNKTLTATLSSPVYASLGPIAIATLTLTDPVAPAAIPTLDVDGDGHYDVLSDGLLVVRYLFGLTGSALTNGAVAPHAQRTDSASIIAYLDAIRGALDVDNDSQVQAMSDGLMILRYMFGLRGALMANGAIGVSAQRTVPQIETYIQSLMP